VETPKLGVTVDSQTAQDYVADTLIRLYCLGAENYAPAGMPANVVSQVMLAFMSN